MRRVFAGCGLLLGGLSGQMGLTGLASAQSSVQAAPFPSKPVRVVVPFPPGGAIDIIARHVTQRLSESAGVQFVVDNRGGAGGAIGTESVARAAPDGYSLLVSSTSPMAINPHINRVKYDPLNGFTAIGMIGYTPEVLVVHPSLPVRTVRDLIAMGKAKPGTLSFASSGVGTIIHVTAELFAQRAGIRMLIASLPRGRDRHPGLFAAAGLAETWGQPVVADNPGGANDRQTVKRRAPLPICRRFRSHHIPKRVILRLSGTIRQKWETVGHESRAEG